MAWCEYAILPILVAAAALLSPAGFWAHLSTRLHAGEAVCKHSLEQYHHHSLRIRVMNFEFWALLDANRQTR